MLTRSLLAGLSLLLTIPVAAAPPLTPYPSPPGGRGVRGEGNAAAAEELAKMIHAALVKKAPKEYKDDSDWGNTIPVPPNLRFPRLRRTVVKVGDRMELPHGGWVRSKVWLDDPAKDIQIRVSNLEKTALDTVRLRVAATVDVHGWRERQQWIKGVRLVDLDVRADARLTAVFDCEAKISFKNGDGLLPKPVVEPKVLDCTLKLEAFDLNRVGPVLFLGETRRELGEELRGVLQELIRRYEPEVKERINESLAASIREGKGLISPAQLLKLGAKIK